MVNKLLKIYFFGFCSYLKWIGNRRMNKVRVLSFTFLLGLTWIFGFLLFNEWLAFAYIFTVAIGLQGIVIFLGRRILNNKIRTALKDSFKLFPKCLVENLIYINLGEIKFFFKFILVSQKIRTRSNSNGAYWSWDWRKLIRRTFRKHYQQVCCL